MRVLTEVHIIEVKGVKLKSILRRYYLVHII